MRIGTSCAKAPGKYWSGRRGSNPQPTAWEAATLPLSYSRLRNTLLDPAWECAYKLTFCLNYSCPFRINDLRNKRSRTGRHQLKKEPVVDFTFQ